MVLAVITVYVVCWAPYWIFQITMLFLASFPSWIKVTYQVITILSYCNSALNPVLYAFLSENFRKTFVKAFQCASAAEVNRSLLPEHGKDDGEMKERNKVAGRGGAVVCTGSGGARPKKKSEPEKETLIATGSNEVQSKIEEKRSNC